MLSNWQSSSMSLINTFDLISIIQTNCSWNYVSVIIAGLDLLITGFRLWLKHTPPPARARTRKERCLCSPSPFCDAITIHRIVLLSLINIMLILGEKSTPLKSFRMGGTSGICLVSRDTKIGSSNTLFFMVGVSKASINYRTLIHSISLIYASLKVIC